MEERSSVIMNQSGNISLVEGNSEDLTAYTIGPIIILPPRQEAEINSGEEQEPGTPDNEEGRETKSSEE